MKRILLCLSILLSLASFGQSIVRKGEVYFVDGTPNNSTAFNAYLKNTNPELFAQYNKGYQIAMSGWGLFAVGVPAIPISVMMMMANQDNGGYPFDPVKDAQYRQARERWGIGWCVGLSLAGAAAAASIPLLAVGYHKMHKSVDTYSAAQVSAPQTYWTMEIKPDGIGLACHF